ncbi:MAG: hypothetical protein EBY17_30535 [Acidobacteriia bacterium]|nr:hypothetical protein [Terriglobia bacterium]
MKHTLQQTAGAKLETTHGKPPGEKLLGAAKVSSNNGPLWCHVSERDGTRKLRRFAEGNFFEVETELSDIEDYVPLGECKKLLPGQQSYSFEAVSVWTKILGRLEAGGAKASVESAKKSGKQNIVPITRLRRYYSSMKVFDSALFEGIAKFYRDTPGAMEQLWNDSLKAFEPYSNPEGWGLGTRRPLPEAPHCLQAVSSTDEFTAFAKTSGLAEEGFSFSFVEREINPWRTRNAVFSDKRPATKTGRGGIDLLLATSEGVPVIGEVKVKDDKNAFFALLQAMTYAVELSTTKQQERLKTHFPQFDKLDPEYAVVDIAIILVNPVPDATREPVKSLITLMNKRRKCGGLRRIMLVWNEGERWFTHS